MKKMMADAERHTEWRGPGLFFHLLMQRALLLITGFAE